MKRKLTSRHSIKRRVVAAAAVLTLITAGTVTAQVLSSSRPQLLVSDQPPGASPGPSCTASVITGCEAPLSQANLSGEVYIFFRDDSGAVSQVRFFVDDPAGAGTPAGTASTNPFVLSYQGTAPTPASPQAASPAPVAPSSGTDAAVPPTTGAGTAAPSASDGGTAPDSQGSSEDEGSDAPGGTDDAGADDEGHDESGSSDDEHGSDDEGGSEDGADEGHGDDQGAEDHEEEARSGGGASNQTSPVVGGAGTATSAQPGVPTSDGGPLTSIDTATAMADGPHSVMAEITTTSGTVSDLFARFTVNNGGAAPSAPAPATTSGVGTGAAPAPTTTGSIGAGIIPAGYEVLFSGDWETGDLTQWNSCQWQGTNNGCDDNDGSRVTVVQDQVREGQYAARFELQDGDEAASGERAEVASHGGGAATRAGDERWYEVSVLLPEDFQNPMEGGHFILIQWHSSAGSPPLALEISSDGEMHMSGDGSGGGDQMIGPIQRGVWMDYVIHVVFSSGDDGLVEVWENGVQKVSENRANMSSDENYLKHGIYRNSSESDTEVIYMDGLKVYGPAGSGGAASQDSGD